MATRDKQKEVKPEAEAVDETPLGVTVGVGTYRPIPRFRGGCPNC